MNKQFEQIISERTKYGEYLVGNVVKTLLGRVSEDVIIETALSWKTLSGQEKYLAAKIIGGKYNLGFTLALIDGLQEELK